MSPSTQRALAAAALAFAVVGCSLRIGAPPAPIPTPSAEETSRQSAAIAVANVMEAAKAGGPSPALTALAEASNVYLEELGGMWVPPPRDEDPSPSAPVDLTGEPPALTEEATLARLRTHSDTLLELAVSADIEAQPGPDALASMWLTVHTAAVALAGEAELPCPEPCGSGMLAPALREALGPGGPGPAPAELLTAVREEAPELIGTYDALGYVEQTRAARSGGEDRDDIAAQARELFQVGELFAGELAGTARDPRLSAYPLDVDDLPGTSARISRLGAQNWLALYPRLGAPAREVAAPILWFAYRAANPSGEVEVWPGIPAG